jgi:hypothetical protein
MEAAWRSQDAIELFLRKFTFLLKGRNALIKE